MHEKIGKNNSDLIEMNRSAVVKILQQREICSRADIAKETGLTPAAITKVVAELMRKDIVSEVGMIKGTGNRRSIGLKLNADKHQVIGVKFSRQSFAVGVFDISGKVYATTQTDYTIKDDHKAVTAAIKEQVHSMLTHYKNVVAIGFAVPGPYLREKGYIAVITQRPSWHDINFVEEFENEFDRPVFIEHDANAGALAEWWFGNHDRPHTLAYFLVGEGVGSGIIEAGNLLEGTKGAASEIGHISVDVKGPRCECGNYGCLELYCSSNALIEGAERRGTEAILSSAKNSKLCNDIFEAARNGDKNAMKAVKKVAKYIGYGCVTLINAYNPDTIVIGDILALGGDLMMPIIKKVVAERTIPELHDEVLIMTSELEVDGALYGAAATATDKVLELPSAFSNLNKEVVM